MADTCDWVQFEEYPNTNPDISDLNMFELAEVYTRQLAQKLISFMFSLYALKIYNLIQLDNIVNLNYFTFKIYLLSVLCICWNVQTKIFKKVCLFSLSHYELVKKMYIYIFVGYVKCCTCLKINNKVLLREIY